jgi:sporulation protein YabP
MEKRDEEHTLTLSQRRDLRLTGVQKVDSFDDKAVVLLTVLGTLVVRGEGLHIRHLDLERGELMLDGAVRELSYQEGGLRPKGRFVERLWR